MPKIVADSDEFYSPQEAAVALGIGYATLFRWIKDDELTVLKLGHRTLIPKSEVERLKRKASK